MSLETIIAPEIVNDELAHWLTRLARREDVKTILEVGSSSGDGSTQAIVNGMLEAGHDQELFCIEMSKVRFDALKARYAALPFVHCFHGSAVPLDDYMDPEEVHEFYFEHPCNIQKYPFPTVLGWLKQDLEAVKNCSPVPLMGVIFRNSIKGVPDMAVLDGSAFTGYAELQEVYGAKFIVLDDVNDIKHWKSNEFLNNDLNYSMLRSNMSLRNGYAIFQRKDT
jgi:hypothetical protein